MNMYLIRSLSWIIAAVTEIIAYVMYNVLFIYPYEIWSQKWNTNYTFQLTKSANPIKEVFFYKLGEIEGLNREVLNWEGD
jgi:hypothetical protein